jgi:ABC-type transport system substrate-binding protein
MALLLVVAACSSGDEDDTSGTTAAPAPTATQITTGSIAPSLGAAPTQAPVATAAPTKKQVPVQRVIVAIETPARESTDINVICCNDIFQLRPMYDNLIAFNPTNAQYEPALATSWAMGSDGKSLEVQLRKGVQFQKGYGELTAKDAVFTYEHLVTDEGETHNWSDDWGRWVESVEAVSDYEVIYHLGELNANFIVALSDRWSQQPMLSKAYFDANGEPASADDSPLIGTGAYEWVSAAPGINVVYKQRDDAYWRATPDFPEFEFRWMNEASTRLAALLTGEIHVTKLPIDLAPQATSEGMKVINNTVAGPRVFTQFLCCWPEIGKGNPLVLGDYPQFSSSPLLDIRVRQALNKAINRDELTAAFAPHGQPMYVNHFNQNFPGWDERYVNEFPEKYGFDPAAAKALLAEAGYNSSNPLAVNVLLKNILQLSNAQDVMESIAGNWQDIGVKPNLITMDGAARRSAGRAYEIFDHVEITGSSTYQIFGYWVYNSQRASGTGGFNNVSTWQQIMNISATMDTTKHDALLRKLGNESFDVFNSIPLWYVPVQAIVNPEVVDGWVFPGAEHGTWTHIEDIKANFK